MKLSERYSVGTKVGEFEGRPLNTYDGSCPTCKSARWFETRAVADGEKDAEIEVCGRCLTVAKFAALN